MASEPIKNLFANDIYRRIEEVIKVDQTSDDILRDEINEYVQGGAPGEVRQNIVSRPRRVDIEETGRRGRRATLKGPIMAPVWSSVSFRPKGQSRSPCPRVTGALDKIVVHQGQFALFREILTEIPRSDEDRDKSGAG